MENTTYTVAIVDDDPEEMFLIEMYVDDSPRLKLLLVESDPIRALHAVAKRFVDILILDMQMPRLNGVEFIQALEYVPVLIVCSNYTEYVYDTSPHQIAYIRKNIARTAFEKVIDKAIQVCAARRRPMEQSEKTITVPGTKGSERKVVIDCNKLRYAQIDGKIMCFKGEDYELYGRITMQELSSLLSTPPFMQIHKSFLINFNYVESFTSRLVLMKKNKEVINIGDERYKTFKNAIRTWQSRK